MDHIYLYRVRRDITVLDAGVGPGRKISGKKTWHECQPVLRCEADSYHSINLTLWFTSKRER